jgi:hypothetical protein
MSNVSISNLPSTTAATANNQIPAVQNGTTVYVTVDQIAKYTQTTYPITGITSITAQAPLSGGTITSSGTIGLTTGNLTNNYLANMPANTIKGNNTGSSSTPADLTVAQTMSLLGAAPLASPAFTGVPTAPTPATSDSSTTLATTAYVKAQGYGVGTVNSITAGTGLSGGTITLSGTIAIANTGVNAQNYGTASAVPQITVNAQGQITSATNTNIFISPSQISGLGTMATQNASSVAITGGAINGTVIGATTPTSASFTALTATGNTNLATVTSGTWNGTPIAIAYGGTGATNAITARANLGSAASGANSDITSLSGLTTPLSEIQGGTGYGSYTTGDLLYASSSSTLARLNDVITGNSLISGGVGVAPSWGKIGLSTHVSGTLGTINGGTGLTSFTSGGAVYATSTSALATGTLPVTAGGTGVTTSTGTGSVVLSNSPTLVTPTLGAATATSYTATRALSVSTPYNTGAFNYGTLGYSDTNIFSSFVNSVNSYNEMVLQNTNPGSAASTNFIVSNDQGSSTGYYGEFGMNSSAFVGTSSFNLPNAVYLDATNGDLVIGTTTANAIRFVVNSNSTDAMSISSAGNTTIANLTLSTALPVLSGGTGTTTSTGTGSVVLSTSPTLITPALGTPSTVVLTNATGLPLTTGVTGTLGTTNGGTGLTSFTSGGAVYASSSSALITGTLPITAGGTGTTSFTGTGSVVFSNSPTLVTPSLGTPSTIILTNATNLPLTTGVTGTLAVSNGGTGATTLTGYLIGNGTSAFTAVSTIPNSGLTNSSLTIGTTNISLGATSLTLSGLTTVTVTQDPTTALQLSTKQYVDNQVATVSNQTFHTAVGYATTADLGSVTYNNGTSGVGATLTNAGVQAALAIDGYRFTVTDITNGTRVLVKNQTTGAYNGAYVVTNAGSGSTNWVLTRSTDFNTPGSGPNFIETGASFFVNSGTANGATAWVMNTTGTINVGSTSLVFTQTSSAGNFQVSSPLIKTGNIISLGTVGIGNGGTGQTTASAAFNALSPITLLGDLIVGNGVNSATRLPIGTAGYVLTSNGATATWAASTGGVTSFSGGTTGLTPNTATTGAITLAGTLAIANGGTGITVFGTGVQTALGQNVTGTGSIVLATSPTLVTPALGTPSAAILTNATGLPLTTGVTGTLGTLNGGTGLTTFTAANNAIYSTSASVLTAGTLPVLAGGTGVTTSTGTGNNVLSNSPTLVTPALGTPSSAVLTNATGLPLTTGVTGTLPTANGGTNLASFTSGGAVYATSTTVLTTGTLPITAGGTGITSFGTGVQTALGQNVTGSGGIVLANSPTLVTPALGTPSAAVLTNATGLPLGTGVTGTLGVTNGGTGTTTAFTTGSVVFAGNSGVYSQNNAKFFWDNTNNRLGINTATPQTQLTIVSNTQTTTPTGTLPAGTDLYIVGANAANTRVTQDAYGTGNYSAYTGRSARGTAASPTASQSGDILAQYTARGYGATNFGSASTGYLGLVAAENFTDTAQGTQAGIYTTPTGSNSIVESFRVGAAGQLGVGQGAISYGTSGYVLTSAGASASPTWSQISLPSSVTGTLPAANGGTGQSSYAVGDILYASGTTTLSRLADVATGNVLLSGGVGVAPAWGQVSLTTTVTGILPAANGGTGVANSATLTLAGNVTHSGAFTQTFIATGNTSVTLPTSGTLVNTAVTTLSSLVSIGTITTGTWNASVIGVAYGGTGASSLTANNVLLGNGTSALQVVAPGTSGNVLTSNGTTWVSSTPAASGPSKAQAIAYSMILGF